MDGAKGAGVHAELRVEGGVKKARVVNALLHSIVVALDEESSAEFDVDSVTLSSGERTMELGRCRFFPHPRLPLRRASDPAPQPGSGRLVPKDSVIDFRGLLEKGVVVPLSQRARQLPLVFRRKASIVPPFREYTSDLGYDLQVFRSLLDEIDRSLEREPPEVAEAVRGAAIGEQWGAFCALFDRGLGDLESLTASFSKQEHELHGFYFRKHMWDIILSSRFLARTNIKPRGYAGDSEMMRMVYEDAFVGPTVFSRFMHRHPIRTDAAQAVRNRRGLLADIIAARAAEGPTRVMSVACGPAQELEDVVTSAERAQRLSFTLLDQDAEALMQAQRGAAAVKERIGAPLAVELVRDSVRTMLRAPDLRARWGSFDLVYSMGLFDYLVGPVARAVLGKLYELLSPGGELVVGNFHVGNPTRVYMEYWMDWVLFYRTEEDMLALVKDLPGAEASLAFEDTRSQMFLRVRRSA